MLDYEIKKPTTNWGRVIIMSDTILLTLLDSATA